MKMKLTLSIIVLIALSLYSFNSISAVNQHAATKPTIAHTEQLETYSYVVTEINKEGITGDSLTDDSGIFLTPENVKGLFLQKSDEIKVTFPKDDFETITKVEKVTSAPEQQTDSKYAVFTYTITDVTYHESPENDEYTGKASDGTGIYFTSDYVSTTGQIKVGDKVTAYFDPKNTEDGLIYVKKN